LFNNAFSTFRSAKIKKFEYFSFKNLNVTQIMLCLTVLSVAGQVMLEIKNIKCEETGISVKESKQRL